MRGPCVCSPSLNIYKYVILFLRIYCVLPSNSDKAENAFPALQIVGRPDACLSAVASPLEGPKVKFLNLSFTKILSLAFKHGPCNVAGVYASKAV